MAIGLYVVPYARRSVAGRPTRYCQMDDFTAQILADGGIWLCVEILGNVAIVKVRASASTLTTLAAQFDRIPISRLKDSLASLTAGQRTALRDKALALGYTLIEFQAALGTDLTNITLRQYLRFLATRRIKPRYNQPTDEIMLDGPIQGCGSVDLLDTDVRDV